jgi:hypothetical protein
MSEAAAREIVRILEEIGDADDALRRVVALLVDEPNVVWAGVAFLEDGNLTLGPSAGSPDEARRIRAPIVFQGDHVGGLLADGTADPALLTQIAGHIAPLVLIGWDTGGEPWEP